MNLVVLNRVDYSIVFSTTVHKGIIKIMQENTMEMVKIGEVTKKQDQYQLAIKIEKNVIFGGIRPFGEKYRRNFIDFDKMLKNLSKISRILLNNSKITSDFESTFDRIFLAKSKAIRLIGRGYNAGVNTIMYLIEGITISSLWEDHHIICIRNNNTIINLKNFSGPRRFDLVLKQKLPIEKNVFYIVNSADSGKINEENHFARLLKNPKSKQEVLIIANKQDLPNAINPERIEHELGYTTVGFSAIAPDAPEQLEKTINEFLKNNH